MSSVRILLIHQNFPGQFRQLLPRLQQQGHDVRAICSHQRPLPDEIQVHRYPEPDLAALQPSISGLEYWAEGLSRAPQVRCIASDWQQQGWSPHLILGHSGWGETLLLHQVWPAVPQVLWPELWVQASNFGVLEPPDGPGMSSEQCADLFARNQLTRAALQHAAAWVLPTAHQAASFPSDLASKRLHVIHEGIDASIACPNPNVEYVVRGIAINRSTPTITFVNRNLERLRGFDQFMHSLPKILKQHSSVRVMIVGDNGAGYAGGQSDGPSLKQQMLAELGTQLDLERVHFLGRVPYPTLLALLQASWVHVYLSRPFILGWSLLEAMACGCCVVGSEGIHVSEAIQHGRNGMLVPFTRPDQLSRVILDLLANAALREQLSVQARQDALGWDHNVMWPKLSNLFASLTSSRVA